ncbi:hypothetical protein D3C80_1744520 [compost metagenome]
MDAFNQRLAALRAKITPALTIDPTVFAVRLNHDAQFRQCRRVSHSMRGNRHYGSGRWGVDREHTSATEGQLLATQHGIAHVDAQFALSADVLF